MPKKGGRRLRLIFVFSVFLYSNLSMSPTLVSSLKVCFMNPGMTGVDYDTKAAIKFEKTFPYEGPKDKVWVCCIHY